MRLVTLSLIPVLLGTAFASAEPGIDAIQQTLPEKARNALDQIPEPSRKLLALRSYLRSANSLDARWSWSQEQIQAYLKSDQYVSAMAAVAAVTRAFELKNPGYTLHVNTDVRSLEEQLAKWNSNGSVKAAATELSAATAKWLTNQPNAGPDALRVFLTGFRPVSTVMLAAPGLTNHGRGEAIDFQIAKGSTVVMGAGSSAQWESEGWKAKLQEAVRLSTMPFAGPLQEPNEPWHYDYEPPEHSELVVATQPWPSPVAPAMPSAATAFAPDQPVAPPVAGSVPVPAPRPGATARTDAEKPEVVVKKATVATKPVKRTKLRKKRRR